MVARTKDLWSLVWGKPQIDPNDLAAAVQDQARSDDLDYRTRMLIRDSVEALRSHWGQGRVSNWLDQSPTRSRIESICREQFDKVGFSSLGMRLMDKTDPEQVRQFLRELSTHVRSPMRLLIGGSIALIVPGHLSRATEDIDVVDEVPSELRNQHAMLEDMKKRYGLELTHFQSHYLPSGWMNRLRYHDSFGDMTVYFVDPCDVFLSKLTSIRTKDLDDLRALVQVLDKNILVERLKNSMASTFAAKSLRERAEQNWFVVFGEKLPQ
jgi:hypothetical protein